MTSCVCDYDPATVYEKTDRIARKEHKCDECHRTIHVGEAYERVCGLWEGRWDAYKTCIRCLRLREYVKAHVPCFCWAHGNMIEDAINTAQEFAYETVGLLFGAYRRQVLIDRGERVT